VVFDVERARRDTPGVAKVAYLNNARAAMPPTVVTEAVIVCSGSVQRVAAATGEGSAAVRLAFERLQSAGTADPVGLAAR
jgi:hypothetical protein